MKNISTIITALLLLFITSIHAQTDQMADNTSDTEGTVEDYKKYYESMIEMDMRNFIIKSLSLSKEEILAFDPIFNDYMNKKYEWLDERTQLLSAYNEEIQTYENAEEKSDETSDFIEDYWNQYISLQELQKDYFDDFEDKIGWNNAIKFFMLEEAAQQKALSKAYSTIVPDIEKFYVIKMNPQKIKREKKKNRKYKSSNK